MEPWSPDRLETGLGGSESAVLQLASRWARDPRCTEVAIYLRLDDEQGEPEDRRDERVWRGVRLIDSSKFNPADTFDALIVWRSLELLDEPLAARRIVLDLHDMPLVNELTCNRCANVFSATNSNPIVITSTAEPCLGSHLPSTSLTAPERAQHSRCCSTMRNSILRRQVGSCTYGHAQI